MFICKILYCVLVFLLFNLIIKCNQIKKYINWHHYNFFQKSNHQDFQVAKVHIHILRYILQQLDDAIKEGGAM